MSTEKLLSQPETQEIGCKVRMKEVELEVKKTNVFWNRLMVLQAYLGEGAEGRVIILRGNRQSGWVALLSALGVVDSSRSSKGKRVTMLSRPVMRYGQSVDLREEFVSLNEKERTSKKEEVPVIAVATGPMSRNTVRRRLRKFLATLYFEEITLSFCIRDPQLGKSIGAATALEVRATGIPYVFAPCIAGFVILDWQGIDRITSLPHSSYTYSVLAGIQTGIDMVMVPLNQTEFIDDLTYLVKNKFIPTSRIDDVVRRILHVKFTMGLFENPWLISSKSTSSEVRSITQSIHSQM
ncbi:hypothetical protein HHK36_022196 [Tetracentron sinense]|uniref:Uncharacterized protein n=1 Tax=Tetracentron sinense TaxID=13715 RepID=A0A835D627_TETSI|nr:hypothetical protein HHK36_022196 [Tetracentron sinense]